MKEQEEQDPNYIKNLLSRVKLSPENEKDFDSFVQASVDSLNRSSGESAERSDRYDKIYAVERKKWPHGMGSMRTRDDVPEHLQDELEKCIVRSQIVARDACQTQELTDKYLAENLG
jgi:thiamine pyrophosphate-dependent acetolactate synthase large subunit-like protein